MEAQVIQHPPRALHLTVLRTLEFESDCPDCPQDRPDVVAECADCGRTMAYRGIGTLRNRLRVHYFECVHGPSEVHGMSVVIAD